MGNRIKQSDRLEILRLEKIRLKKIFFGEINEKINKEAEKEFLKTHNKKLLQIANDPDINHYFRVTDRYSLESSYGKYSHLQFFFSEKYICIFTKNDHCVLLTDKLRDLCKKYESAEKEYINAVKLISSALNSYTSVKNLFGDIPELEKYKYLFGEHSVIKYELMAPHTVKAVREILSGGN